MYSKQEITQAMIVSVSMTDSIGFGDRITTKEVIDSKTSERIKEVLMNAGIEVSITEAFIFWSWHSTDYAATWLIPGSDESIVGHFIEFIETMKRIME